MFRVDSFNNNIELFSVCLISYSVGTLIIKTNTRFQITNFSPAKKKIHIYEDLK